nr:hypothetical protein [uncultured Dyadobacter sp.]
MNEKGYPFSTLANGSVYTFESIGQNKTIQKLVLITPTRYDKLFNVALLDVLNDGETSDEIESKNGDMVEVLATVFSILKDFLDENPDTTLVFRGSDQRRHRLYRIILARELPGISGYYIVYGGTPQNLIPFQADVDSNYYFLKKL